MTCDIRLMLILGYSGYVTVPVVFDINLRSIYNVAWGRDTGFVVVFSCISVEDTVVVLLEMTVVLGGMGGTSTCSQV